MVQRVLLAIAFLLFTGIVIAQEETEEEGPWEGTVSLGFLSTSGNTDTTTYNTKFEVGYTRNDWEHRMLGSSTGSEDTGATTAENYQLGWRSGYYFTERDFVFGTVDWRKDRFAGVVEQMSYALNYGRSLIESPNHQLDVSIGAGYRDSDRSDGTNENNAIGRGGLAYNHHHR